MKNIAVMQIEYYNTGVTVKRETVWRVYTTYLTTVGWSGFHTSAVAGYWGSTWTINLKKKLLLYKRVQLYKPGTLVPTQVS